MERLDKLTYDTIILGGNLEALVHSYVEGIPLIMVNPQVPFHLDLDTHGYNKSKIWAKLSYLLSYVGLNPIGLKALNYSIEDNNLIIFGKSPYKIEIKFNNIIRYDLLKSPKTLRVFDYLQVQNMMSHHVGIVNKINSGDDFVNHFHTNIEKNIKYICAVSNISDLQIQKEEYSEIYARLKSIELLKSAGVTGFIENLKTGGQRKHLIKVTSLKRYVIPDTIEEENKVLHERRETKNKMLQNITKILGSPYVV